MVLMGHMIEFPTSLLLVVPVLKGMQGETDCAEDLLGQEDSV